MSEVDAYLRGFIKAAGLPKAQPSVKPVAQKAPVVKPQAQPSAMLPVPERALNAEWMQEASMSKNWGITGDNGKALGPLQIHQPAYQDAIQYDKSLAAHPYSYVTNLPYAKQIYTAYQNRYNKPALQELQTNATSTNALKQLFAAWNGGGVSKFKTPGTSKYVDQTLAKYLKMK